MEQHHSGPSQEKKARSLLKTLLLRLGMAVFVFGGLVSGGLTVAHLTGAAIAAPRFSLLLPDDNGPNWGNKERVNILFLGIDRRPSEGMNAPTRTDTMMLVTLDPYSKTAGMLSIPRDLWVPIPYNDNRILYDRVNTANVYGALYNYPGGGTALAKDTIQYNLGVRVHYYVMIDFQGFKAFIDSVGGIDIEVPKALEDWEYPTDDYETMHIFIPAGEQHLDGERALWYARSRHGDSDFGRMHRQQQVLLSVRQRLLQLNMLPKLPALWGQFNDMVQTDLSFPELVSLASAAREVNPADIQGFALEQGYVTSTITQDGAYILLPNRSQIGDLIAQVFFDPRKEQEAAHIEVLNGTSAKGLASRTAQQLQKSGFLNVSIGDAERIYTQTEIQNLTGKPYTTNLLASYLKLPKDRIKQSSKAEGEQVDIRIILGDDAPQILPPLQ